MVICWAARSRSPSRGLVTESQHRGDMCAGWWGLRRRQAKPEPSQCRANAAALLSLASMRSWMAPEGTVGRGRSFRPRASPSRPSHPRCGSHRPIEDLLLAPGLRSPPDDCGEIPVAWRTTQSSIGKYVPDANRSRTAGRLSAAQHQLQPGPRARPRLSRLAAGGWRLPGRRGSRV